MYLLSYVYIYIDFLFNVFRITHLIYLPPPVFPLTCAVQNYAWGKIGMDSEVAKLVVGGDLLAVIEDGKHYAEVIAGEILITTVVLE